MKVIALKNIILEKNTITYKFDIPEELRKHINMEYIDEHNQGTLFVRPQKETKLEEIPKSILSIPFIGTMMGIAMLYQIPIKVDEVDADYLKSTQELGLIFNKMYPQGNLKLKVISDRVIENKKNSVGTNKTSVFFTGGVDATSALVETINLKPLLINIVGGDIALSNQKST